MLQLGDDRVLSRTAYLTVSARTRDTTDFSPQKCREPQDRSTDAVLRVFLLLGYMRCSRLTSGGTGRPPCLSLNLTIWFAGVHLSFLYTACQGTCTYTYLPVGVRQILALTDKNFGCSGACVGGLRGGIFCCCNPSCIVRSGFSLASMRLPDCTPWSLLK